MNIQERLKYPEPNFIREKTEIINDGWLFSFDGDKWENINVPFCPESKLSGIAYTDFIPQCFYKKSFYIEKNNERIVIHFGAVDYRCELYVNGKHVGSHVGGYTSFAFDITEAVVDGDNELYLVVLDDELRDCPSGKQAYKKNSFGCFYTRTTGIWQNVWIERTPKLHIKQLHFYPSVKEQSVTVKMLTNACGQCDIKVFYENRLMGEYHGEVDYFGDIKIGLKEKHLWEIGNGRLYDVVATFGTDSVSSYFGLREVAYQGYDFLLNGETVFQKLVLDQGYYPDGVYTAPDIDAMEKDIRIALDVGFNGARLHQKVFEPRFLYLCDVIGYMVWGEFANWGVDYSDLHFVGRFLQEWEESLARDFNHPAIITWCPLNEVWGSWEDPKHERDVRFIDLVYNFTKTYDTTRPCLDVSGGHHGHKTDIYDFHCYADSDELKKYLEEIENSDKLDVPLLYCENEELKYQRGMPSNLSEFGGIRVSPEENILAVDTVNEGAVSNEEAWGYGKVENNADELVERYEALVNVIFNCKKISGFCYTQLYDVEQEENGLYYYNRSDKLSAKQKARMREINSRR